MVILADPNRKELGSIQNANVTVDLNGNRNFSVQIARSNLIPELTFSYFIYIPGTEYGGIIGQVLTDTTLDYVELKGHSWRGRLAKKVIEPPAGQDYKKVSGELHTVMKELIEPAFGGNEGTDSIFYVPDTDTGVAMSNYQFDRYCTLLDGITKMLKSKGYRLQIAFRRNAGEPGKVFIEAVPIVDYSSEIELSKDCQLNYTMEDIRDGINHLVVTGKGELQDRKVLHLYVQKNGSIGKTQYYTGLDEIAEVYENTSTETDELEETSRKKLQELMNKQAFKMDVASLGLDVNIGDIVGGRDYLTGMYMSEPVENIIYSLTNGVEAKTYKLEGEES